MIFLVYISNEFYFNYEWRLYGPNQSKTYYTGSGWRKILRKIIRKIISQGTILYAAQVVRKNNLQVHSRFSTGSQISLRYT